MGSMPTEFDYASLKELLKSTNAEVFLPGDGEVYEKSIVRWSEHCIKRAAAVVKVTSADDVSATLALIRAHDIAFTVRGGGHSTSAASSIEDGLVIDLSKMRKVTVNPETKTINVEGGAIWEDVDLEVAKYELAAVGGTVNHTGVGGLTLGGGYGYLTGRHGLAIDNLLSVDIVLASGEQVTASSTSNPDLFWAVRGAGQNFGVATRFTFQAHDQKNHVFAGALIFTPDKLRQVVEFANKVHATNDGNQVFIWGFSAPPPVLAPVVITQLFHNGTEADGKAFFADLFELGPILNMTSMVPYEVVNSLLNHAATFDGRKQSGGGAFKMPIQPEVVLQLHEEFTAFVASHERMNESLMLFEQVPYQKLNEVSNEQTAFSNRGEYYNVATLFKWFDPALDNEIRKFSQNLITKASKSTTGKSEGDGVGTYGNYATVDVDAKDIFGANVKRLGELKAKYDPADLFCHNLRLTPRRLASVN